MDCPTLLRQALDGKLPEIAPQHLRYIGLADAEQITGLNPFQSAIFHDRVDFEYESGVLVSGMRVCGQTTLVLRESITEGRMNRTEPSIFDLSPAEKLQLVEDLWDDIAGTPEAVPVHDWQKQELARRKANLLKNPAAARSWEGVKQRVRARYGP